MRRFNCGSCGHDDLRTILDLGLSPIADAYTPDNRLVAHYPLQLAACRGCHLVQLTEVVSPEILFGTGYSFYSSASAPLSDYHRAYADDVIKGLNWIADVPHNGFVVEVGCNDGDMLRHFAAAGFKTLGVDPAHGPVAVARDRGLDVVPHGLTRELAREIQARHGTAGTVIANHVLAHVEDVAIVVSGIATLLDWDGVAYVEVQYLPDLLLHNAFDLVYHEHRNFFTLTSLIKAVEPHGLYVADVEFTDRQGGSLRAMLRHTRGASSLVERTLATESWLTDRDAFAGLQGRVERVRDRLCALVDRHGGDYLIGYGAPAKATTLLNFCGIDSTRVALVTDTTAAKQGRYIPGTGIKIVAPAEAADRRIDTYLLLAWNYLTAITRNEVEFTRNGGRWIVPIPVPTLL